MKRLNFIVVLAILLAGQGWGASRHERDSYIGKAQAELDQWGAKIQKLQSQSEQAGEKSRVAIDKQLHSLDGRFQEAQKRLEALKVSTEKEWDKIRPGVDHALAQVRHSYRRTQAYFQNKKQSSREEE